MSSKRKQSAQDTGGKKACRQVKLTQLFSQESCPHCAARFSTVDQLIQHVETTHLSGSRQVCNAADATTAAEAQLPDNPAVPAPAKQAPAHNTTQQQAPDTDQQQQQQYAWWKHPPEDPVVAHIRFTSSQSLQPVRLSALSAIAPVELVLQALPAALASSLLSDLLVQSDTWVAGSWWFGGQQQTAPRSSVTYTLMPDDTLTDQQSPTNDQPASPPDSQVPAALHTTPHSSSSAVRQPQQGLASSSDPVQVQEAKGHPVPDPQQQPAASTLQLQATHSSTDLPAVPQRPPPPSLQQAASLVTQAVNARITQQQQQHWQQQRQVLTTQLLAVSGAGGREGGGGVRHGDPGAQGSRVAPIVYWNPAAAAATAGDAGDVSGGACAASHQEQRAAGSGAALPTASSSHVDGWTGQMAATQQQQQQHSGAGPARDAAAAWWPSYVLANLYKDGQQSVGSHADRLSSLGPLPTIASVSLGAQRIFRLHPADKAVAAAAAAGLSGGAGSSSSVRLVSSIDIQLPHNSLLIMWPPTQEQWKHEVPKTKAVVSHPLSGPARINLTFRQLHHIWAAAVPACRCGRPAIMRCGLQGSSFVYYYACDNTRGPGCGLYQRAVVLDTSGG